MPLSAEEKSELDTQGFIFLETDPDLSTGHYAKNLGNIADIPELSLVQKLTPKKREEAPKNIYSGNFGMDEFPLHTDLAHWHTPPHYFLLRAIVPAENVATRVIHFTKCIENLSPNIIRKSLFKPRRAIDNKFFLLRLLNNNIFRWDQLFLVPENAEAEIAAIQIREMSKSIHLKNVFLNKTGDCLLIDNWKTLHGRSPVLQEDQLRLIERVYLSEIF